MSSKKLFGVLFFSLLMFIPMVFAQDADIAQITEPLNKIYDLVKGVISIVAVLAITFAGAKFMFSGDNPQARDNSKGIVTYAIVGLVLVWIAPSLVNFLTAPPV